MNTRVRHHHRLSLTSRSRLRAWRSELANRRALHLLSSLSADYDAMVPRTFAVSRTARLRAPSAIPLLQSP